MQAKRRGEFKVSLRIALFVTASLFATAFSFIADEKLLLEFQTPDVESRTALSNQGLDLIEVDLEEGRTLAISNSAEIVSIEGSFSSQPLPEPRNILEETRSGARFHTVEEIIAGTKAACLSRPDICAMVTMGDSIEGRPIIGVKISDNPTWDESNYEAGSIIIGTHHAREHITSEISMMTIQRIIQRHDSDSRLQKIVKGTEIWIFPVTNPDGAIYDMSDKGGQRYHSWRKNRRLNPKGSYGVDLNRNYGYLWNTGGSSSSETSQTYHGTGPFSEPETSATRDFIRARKNITTLLTLHSYSQLVLYPWGHSYDPVEDSQDHQVFKTMAQKMASYNKYTAKQSSGLYKTSGDTTDWAYGELGIFAFTFELDPKSIWSGGFYPDPKIIVPCFEKNWGAIIYLIEKARNPYSVLAE